MEPVIEILKPEEWEKYKEIRLRALRINPEAYGSALEQEINYSPEEWRQKLASTDRKTYAAKIGRKIVALANYSLEKPLQVRHLVTLHAVFVEPEFRRQGIGLKLLRKLLDDLHKNPITSVVFLEVNNEAQPAKNFYKKLGFVEFGVAQNEIRVRDKYYAMAHMYLTFKDKL